MTLLLFSDIERQISGQEVCKHEEDDAIGGEEEGFGWWSTTRGIATTAVRRDRGAGIAVWRDRGRGMTKRADDILTINKVTRVLKIVLLIYYSKYESKTEKKCSNFGRYTKERNNDNNKIKNWKSKNQEKRRIRRMIKTQR